jgi:hypothetical protein
MYDKLKYLYTLFPWVYLWLKSPTNYHFSIFYKKSTYSSTLLSLQRKSPQQAEWWDSLVKNFYLNTTVRWVVEFLTGVDKNSFFQAVPLQSHAFTLSNMTKNLPTQVTSFQFKELNDRTVLERRLEYNGCNISIFSSLCTYQSIDSTVWFPIWQKIYQLKYLPSFKLQREVHRKMNDRTFKD